MTILDEITPDETSALIIAVLIIFAVSPPGVYLARLAFYATFGGHRPAPPCGGREKDTVRTVENLAGEHAELRTRTEELEAALEDVTRERDLLISENEALRDALRARDRDGSAHAPDKDPVIREGVRSALNDLELPGDRLPSANELRSAWRAAVKRYHPDVFGTSEDPEMIRRVNAAWDLLRPMCEKRT